MPKKINDGDWANWRERRKATQTKMDTDKRKKAIDRYSISDMPRWKLNKEIDKLIGMEE